MRILLTAPSALVPSKVDSATIAAMQARLALHSGRAQAIKRDLAEGKITDRIITATHAMTSHIKQARKLQDALKKLEEAGNK